MQSARWRAARELFDEVIDLPPELRAQRLGDAARADPELCREVERLLAADAAADARLASLDGALGLQVQSASGSEHETADPLGVVGGVVAHFRVIEPIASGGMGVVYRAEDTRLGRTVALKLPLRHCLTDAAARRRFLREGRAAGALDHQNVCAVLEVGDTDDGHLYIAMALCAGETLKARLTRESALPAALAVDVARAIARGLGAAHEAGVVHRDVKPGNVMLLPDGGVKVLDFGLALVRDLELSASRTITGTVAYMAPEQIRGEPVDARADLWALGVVLYEMLAGRRPFVGEHDAAITYAIVHEEPPPLAVIREDVPPALADVVHSLLAKDPARRPATAGDVEVALDAASAASSAQPSWRRRVATWRRRGPHRRAVALVAVVLVVSVAAAGVPLLRPAGHGATTPGPVRERPPTANREAYAFYLRGREYEGRGGTRDDLEGARQLYLRALALDPTFALARARLSIVLTDMAASRIGVRSSIASQARSAAEAALRAQPALGEAHLALGKVWLMEQAEDSALHEFYRAASAMPKNPEAHVAIGTYLRDNGRWADALTHFERAALLDSSDAALLQQLALTESRLRRYEAATHTWDRVLAQAPDNHNGAIIRGWVFVKWLGVTDSLSAALRTLPPEWDPRGIASWARFNVARIERHPAAALAVVTAMPNEASQDGMFYRPRALMQAQAYADMGDRPRSRALFQRARAQLAESLAVHPSAARYYAALGLTFAGLGQRVRALSAADSAMTLGEVPKVTPFSAAMTGEAAEIHARVGDVDGALALIERLLSMPAGREMSVATLRTDPIWDPLRADPRFEPMLRRFANR